MQREPELMKQQRNDTRHRLLLVQLRVSSLCPNNNHILRSFSMHRDGYLLCRHLLKRRDKIIVC